MTQLNIPVTHLLIPLTSKTVINGSWLQDPGIVRKGELPNNMKV